MRRFASGVLLVSFNDMTQLQSTAKAPITSTQKVRTVEAIHKSTRFHWVGDGFFVSTYFPSQNLPAERVSPFVLMDYGPPKDFAPAPRGKRGVVPSS